MLGAGLLAKKAVERGSEVKPCVKTSLAPGSRVVTDYSSEAGLTAVPRGAAASTSSATAARPASATAARCPSRSPTRSRTTIWWSRRCSAAIAISRGASTRRSRQLSGLAAAGGGLCAGGHGRHRSDQRAARATTRTASRSICKDIWPTQRGGRARRMQTRSMPGMFQASTRTSSTATRLEALPVPDGRAVRVGPGLDVRPGAAVLRRI